MNTLVWDTLVVNPYSLIINVIIALLIEVYGYWLDSRWKFSERMTAQILYWFMLLIIIRTIILFIAFYFFVLSSYCLVKKSESFIRKINLS